MKLTAEHVKAMYGCLVDLPPFNKWNLPDKHDVDFRVLKTPRWHADHWKDSGHHIRVSSARCSHAFTLLRDVAHEMVHLHLKHNKIHERHDHGIAFRTAASLVCRELGLDPLEF